jgi:two-component system, OmpR family, response regulator MprA
MDGRLLVVEDDPQVRAMLTRALSYEGFDVRTAADAGAAMASIRAAAPDLILLDLLLPDEDGVEVCRRLRAGGERLPILMVTARDTVSDRVEGLDAGADDYLVKPFSTAELVARVRALLRRVRSRGPDHELRAGDLLLDTATHEVRRGDRPIELTRREFELLCLLMENAGTVLTRERLLTEGWGFEAAVETNALDVYVGYLRRKLEERGEPRLLHTVRGVGFVLRPEPGA